MRPSYFTGSAGKRSFFGVIGLSIGAEGWVVGAQFDIMDGPENLIADGTVTDVEALAR